MKRSRIILSWACSSIRFTLTRSVLTILAIGLATAFIAGTLSFQHGFKLSLERNIESMGYQVLVTGKGCPHEAATLMLQGGTIPMYIHNDVYEKILAEPEVGDATRFFMQSVPLEEENAHQLYVGIDEKFLRLKSGVTFQGGAWFTSNEADEVILGFNVAEYRRLGIGDAMEVQGRKFTVRGILDKFGTQDDGSIFMPLSVCQDLFERGDFLTGIGIRVKDLSVAGNLIDRLYDKPSIQVVRMSQVQSTILRILTGLRAFLMTFGLLCLALALMSVFNVSLITANERISELGVLRALGSSSGTLFKLVWSETLLLSLAGVVLGAILTVVFRGGAEWVVRSTLHFVPAGTVIVVTTAILLKSCFAVLVLSLLAGVYPAAKSAFVPPVISMRGTSL